MLTTTTVVSELSHKLPRSLRPYDLCELFKLTVPARISQSLAGNSKQLTELSKEVRIKGVETLL